MRFQAQQTGALVGVKLLVQEVIAGVTLTVETRSSEWEDGERLFWRLRLENDDGTGRPSGTVLAENIDNASKAFYEVYSRLEYTFNPAPTINQGEIYHLVIFPEDAELVDGDNYITVLALKPLHADNMWLDYRTNENRGVLFSDDGGQTWEMPNQKWSKTYNREPVYVLELDLDGDGEGDVYEGNPHYKAGNDLFPLGFYGYTGGEEVRMARDVNAAAVEFYLQTENGKPHDLYYGLDTFFEDVIRAPHDISDFNWEWVRFPFRAPRILWENDVYRVYLASPWSDRLNHVSLNALKSSYYWDDETRDTSFGGADSRGIYSYDGRQNWTDKKYWDIPFRFVTRYRYRSGLFESPVFDAGQVVDWKYVEWDAVEPLGTQVKIRVRAGNDPELTGNWSEWITVSGSNLEAAGIRNSRYIQYQAQLLTNRENVSPALLYVRIGYCGGFGLLRLNARFMEYPQQEWIYEGGGVILKQDDKSIMYSPPQDLITVTDEGMPGENLRVEVNLRMLQNITGTGSVTAEEGVFTIHMPDGPRFTVYPAEGPNRDEVELVILSDYAQAWREYLGQISSDINRDVDDANSWVDDSNIGEGEVKLIIEGRLPSGVNDIYYFEKVWEYEIS
jgi:hypothetical protein